MPRVARFKIAALAELLRQLEYAPPETRLRQMEAAERLIADLDPQQNYPEDFIIFRITGYRPDRGDEPITFVGQALLPDLVNLVQHLSERLDLPSDDAVRAVVPIDDVARRLNISRKTIQRYRKQGLICHYFIFPGGVKKLGCYEDRLHQFINGHSRQLQKAAHFTRIDEFTESQIIAQARRLHSDENLSLNESALRLARQTGRAHETIRMMLRRHDRRALKSGAAQPPIFSEPGPLTDRQTSLIHRAWQRGIDSTALAKHFGKTKPTIHRAVNRRRRDLLGALQIAFIRLPTFELPDAADVILSAPAVTTNLNPPIEHDLIEFIAHARLNTGAAPPARWADPLIGAYNFLKMRAAQLIATAAVAEHPTSQSLDRIETDLRWAAMLRRQLIVLALPAAIARIEQNFQQPLHVLATEEIIALMEVAIGVVRESVEKFNPARGGRRAEQRLDRVVALAMDKALAKIVLMGGPSRAAARHAAGSIMTADLFAGLDEWQKWGGLNLRRDLHRHVARLDQPLRDAIVLHHGLEGTPPLTRRELAKQMKIKPVGAARLLQRAIHALRQMVRDER